jgi:hypothetical protein
MQVIILTNNLAVKQQMMSTLQLNACSANLNVLGSYYKPMQDLVNHNFKARLYELEYYLGSTVG